MFFASCHSTLVDSSLRGGERVRSGQSAALTATRSGQSEAAGGTQSADQSAARRTDAGNCRVFLLAGACFQEIEFLRWN